MTAAGAIATGGVPAGAFAVGVAPGGVGAGPFGQNRSHSRNSTAAAMSQGRIRPIADEPSATAALPADIAALPAEATPPATVAVARRAVSAAAPAAPPMLFRNELGLAKPSALVMRLSSAPCKFGTWLVSIDESEVALSPRSPISFFRNVRTIGTTRAIRFVADDVLMPLADESALTSAPLLSPKSAGTSRLVPAFRRSLAPAPPPPNRLPRFESNPVSRFAPLMSDIRPDAPSALAPFCASEPSTAGSSEPSALWVAPGDSPRY